MELLVLLAMCWSCCCCSLVQHENEHQSNVTVTPSTSTQSPSSDGWLSTYAWTVIGRIAALLTICSAIVAIYRKISTIKRTIRRVVNSIRSKFVKKGEDDTQPGLYERQAGLPCRQSTDNSHNNDETPPTPPAAPAAPGDGHTSRAYPPSHFSPSQKGSSQDNDLLSLSVSQATSLSRQSTADSGTSLRSRQIDETSHAAAGVSGDISRTLTENDLSDVLAVIHRVVDWRMLGLELGLLYSTLKAIEAERYDHIECKIKMVSAWLQQRDNVLQKGVPSWNVLMAALQNMGEHETADRIHSN